MESTTVWLAFGAGLLSFLSPCILPLAPGYLSIISGTSLSALQEGEYARSKILTTTAFFILGFSVIFVILGAGSSFLGQLLREHRQWFSRIGGVVVILLGLHQSGLMVIPWLYRERRAELGRPVGLMGAFLAGIAFSLGWTPCVGPILGSILTLAGSQGNLGRGVSLLIAYSLGLAIPFFLLALAFQPAARYLARIKLQLRYLQWISGGLLILVGLLLLTGSFTLINSLIWRWTGGWSPEGFLGK